MYSPSAPDELISVFGFAPGDLDEDVEVWPCNWPAFLLFNRMSTQWRAGTGGAIGLDYSSIRDVAGFLGIKKKKLAEIFPDLQVLEGEALRVMAEERENRP
ncbi:DUF1799 domain-containing protein [uncultured Pseudomonas sp.]|uniref:DUF1799 domain-containing protein n=1 Tax=uncultured Pseudomonas sp. TaxID=114707 RepID=UPI00205B81C3|nr:DUF1799 domain-containing protein [uncultured Pseudomonas sp.]DAM47947.1 MAG TPA: protein of unknown function DUF1799 [Caudoviricetes sp.]